MARKKDQYVVGLDIGTHKVCAIVAQITDEGRLDVIGIGQAESKGVRKGAIINLDATIDAVKRGGMVVQVGLGRPTFTVASATILGKTLVGSLGGTVQDIEEVFDLLLAGEIEPAYSEIAFDEIGEGLERLRRNEVTGRLVARFGA